MALPVPEGGGVLLSSSVAAEGGDERVAGAFDALQAPAIAIPGLALVLILLLCFFGPLVFSLPGPNDGNVLHANLRPFSAGHLLGTDPVGNDVLSRILYGGRISLEVGFGSTAIGLAIGSWLGMIAGYFGRALETVIMRILDMVLSFPSLIIALTIATYLGKSEIHVIYAISFFTVPSFARLARAHVLRLREQVFVKASVAYGARARFVLLRHMAGNVYPNLLTFALLTVGVAIVVESGLSFLGLGVPPPQPSWGNMISQGQTNLMSNPYLVIIPALALFVTVATLNLLGDALRSRWSAQ